MANTQVSVEYLSTGANRHSAIADYSPDGILAFGADTNIAIWRPNVSHLPAALGCRNVIATFLY
jgi:elongator complex protein 2